MHIGDYECWKQNSTCLEPGAWKGQSVQCSRIYFILFFLGLEELRDAWIDNGHCKVDLAQIFGLEWWTILRTYRWSKSDWESVLGPSQEAKSSVSESLNRNLFDCVHVDWRHKRGIVWAILRTVWNWSKSV